MPDCFGEPVVTNSCVCLYLHARLRARRAPGIPCALRFLEGLVFLHHPGCKFAAGLLVVPELDPGIHHTFLKKMDHRVQAEATPFFERLCLVMTSEQFPV
jgi:hypothetical protein